MPPFRARLALALALTFFCPTRAAADVVTCDPQTQFGVICLTGNVSDIAGGGPLVANRVYHLSGFTTVPSGEMLTIESGAILKFFPNAQLEVRGSLQAGAAVLTSLSDDAAGGDTNGDGFSEGTPGDWNGVIFYGTSDASVLDGTSLFFPEAGPVLIGADIVLSDVHVEFSSGIGLNLTSSSFPLVANCQFDFCDFAVSGVPLEAVPAFSGSSALGNTRGDYMYVTDTTMTGNVTIGPGNAIGSEPFVVCRTITVPAGLTLTLQPGTVVKFGHAPLLVSGCGIPGFDVFGTLDLDTVVLTSLADDAVFGDTNKDGGLTLPMPGDWGTLVFHGASDASRLKNTLLHYGGKAVLAPFIAPVLDLLGADITLQGVAAVECAGAGLRLNNSSFPLVTLCAFTDNAGKAVVRAPIAGVQGFSGCTAQGNALDAIEIEAGTGQVFVNGYVPIVQANSLNADGVFVIREDVTIQLGGELELGGGVVFKWSAPGNRVLTVHDKLTANTGPVAFTSSTDDEVGGDTNKDGSATEPDPGDWTGIVFQPGSGDSVLDEALIRYAGNSGYALAAVTISAADPVIANTTIERSETAGMTLLSAQGRPTVDGCTFRDNDLAVTRVPIRAVPGFTDNVATGNANGDYLEITKGDISQGPPSPGPFPPLSIGPSNALLPAAVFVVSTNVTVPVGFDLELLAGTVFKFTGNFDLVVSGTATVGSLGASVVFTSCEDDSIAGDTKKDGFTEGLPGDWGQIRVTANGSFFDDVLVRFAGAGGDDAVRLVGSNAQLHDVRIEDCAGTALAIPSSSPVVADCRFDRNVLAVNQASIRALPGFSGNTASENTIGDYIRVTDGNVSADLLVKKEQSPNQGPFVFATNITALAGNELTVDPEAVFKFEGVRKVIVSGTLTTNAAFGTIVLTTLTDDIAGDTNKDGGTSVPTPGAWNGIEFQASSNGSVLAGARVRFAGAAGSSAIRQFSTDLLVLDTLVERAAATGLGLSSAARPGVRRTHFADGGGLPVDFAPLAAIPGFTDNTASGNAQGDFIRVTTATLSGEVVVGSYNALNSDGVFVVATSVSITTGSTLDLRQGTVFKWEGNRSLTASSGTLRVEGTGLEPVVLTSVHDDSVVGDTQKDGAATIPAPGDWGGVTVNSGAAPSSLENLVTRYGGSFGSSVECLSDFLVARSVRSDFSASDGIRASKLGAGAIQWVACDSAGDGIDVTGGTFDLVHATVTGSGSVGIRKGIGHAGALWNSIVFGNAGGELVGFDPGEVFFSDAGPGFAGVDGNISADPLFVDGASGDLGLTAGSPCIDTAELATARSVAKDHREAPRILDDDLDGHAAADMGAFERSAYDLSFGGEPRVGTTMSFTASGARPGYALFFLGDLSGTTFVDPFGVTLYGPLGSGLVVGAAPVGQPIFVAMPPNGVLVDVPFGVQALVRLAGGAAGGTALGPGAVGPPVGSAGAGSLAGGSLAGFGGGSGRRVPGSYTNLYRGRVRQ